MLYQEWKKHNKSASSHWKMDETYIKVKGKWHYLHRVIDAQGVTLDIWLRRKRDSKSAYAFFKRLLKPFGAPRVIVTDKAPSIKAAFNQLQKNGLYAQTEHRTIKFLNNLIKQDHRSIKKRSRLDKSLRCASVTLKGMETIHAYIKTPKKL